MAGLRIDPLLLAWPDSAGRLREWGYDVSAEMSDKTISGIRRFLADWTRRIHPKYLMVSLAPEFAFPDSSVCSQLIEKAILPHGREFGLPFALMIGVRRAQNPGLKLAGDGMGRTNLEALANLCAQHQDNKFLATVLARENQQELCVLARKFRNLHVFGCWWFTNVPYIVEEMTRMRIELLGLSVTPQHSDARILDQVVYKWHHSRSVIAEVLARKYTDLAEAGWEPTQSEIERDVSDLLAGRSNDSARDDAPIRQAHFSKTACSVLTMAPRSSRHGHKTNQRRSLGKGAWAVVPMTKAPKTSRRAWARSSRWCKQLSLSHRGLGSERQARVAFPGFSCGRPLAAEFLL